MRILLLLIVAVPFVLSQKRRPHARLAKDLQGLMGEANLKFARGQHEEAVKMCMEVIRLGMSY